MSIPNHVDNGSSDWELEILLHYYFDWRVGRFYQPSFYAKKIRQNIIVLMEY